MVKPTFQLNQHLLKNQKWQRTFMYALKGVVAIVLLLSLLGTAHASLPLSSPDSLKTTPSPPSEKKPTFAAEWTGHISPYPLSLDPQDEHWQALDPTTLLFDYSNVTINAQVWIAIWDQSWWLRIVIPDPTPVFYNPSTDSLHDVFRIYFETTGTGNLNNGENLALFLHLQESTVTLKQYSMNAEGTLTEISLNAEAAGSYNNGSYSLAFRIAKSSISSDASVVITGFDYVNALDTQTSVEDSAPDVNVATSIYKTFDSNLLVKIVYSEIQQELTVGRVIPVLVISTSTVLNVTVFINNPSNYTARNLTVTVPLPEGIVIVWRAEAWINDTCFQVERLEPGQFYQTFYLIQAPKPGQFTFSELKVQWIDPLGASHQITGAPVEVVTATGVTTNPLTVITDSEGNLITTVLSSSSSSSAGDATESEVNNKYLSLYIGLGVVFGILITATIYILRRGKSS